MGTVSCMARSLPGGVNQRASAGRGSRTWSYTSRVDSSFLRFGDEGLTRSKVLKIPELLTGECVLPVVEVPIPPRSLEIAKEYAHLSWSTAEPRVKIYDGGFHHVATIVKANRAAGMVLVRFESSGSVEEKSLDAVAPFWYVKR